jgi:hypothetical protein
MLARLISLQAPCIGNRNIKMDCENKYKTTKSMVLQDQLTHFIAVTGIFWQWWNWSWTDISFRWALVLLEWHRNTQTDTGAHRISSEWFWKCLKGNIYQTNPHTGENSEFVYKMCSISNPTGIFSASPVSKVHKLPYTNLLIAVDSERNAVIKTVFVHSGQTMFQQSPQITLQWQYMHIFWVHLIFRICSE